MKKGMKRPKKVNAIRRIPELELRDGALFAERRPGENAANFMRRAGLEMAVV